jgi:hypothetical protein
MNSGTEPGPRLAPRRRNNPVAATSVGVCLADTKFPWFLAIVARAEMDWVRSRASD